MKQPNNPAGRLLNVINLLKRCLNKQSNVRTDAAWASIFKIEQKDIGLLMSHVGAVLQLVNEITELLKRNNASNEIFFRDINLIADAFRQMNLQQSLRDTLARIKDNYITALEYMDDFLSEKVNEKVINENDLKILREQILSLIDQVIESDLEETFKFYLLEKLDMLLVAIQMYDIQGVKPIEKAVNDIIASSVLNQKFNESRTKPIVKKVLGVVGFAFGILVRFNTVMELPENLEKLLPGTRQVISQVVENEKKLNENDNDADQILVAEND